MEARATRGENVSGERKVNARKKVSLTNPYSYDATYTFYTDQPHLLKFSQKSLALPAGQSRYIGLQFAPLAHGKPSAGETRLMVFVNNEEDKNEECMEVSVNYV